MQGRNNLHTTCNSLLYSRNVNKEKKSTGNKKKEQFRLVLLYIFQGISSGIITELKRELKKNTDLHQQKKSCTYA